MKNNYEIPEVVEIDKAHNIILGAKDRGSFDELNGDEQTRFFSSFRLKAGLGVCACKDAHIPIPAAFLHSIKEERKCGQQAEIQEAGCPLREGHTL